MPRQALKSHERRGRRWCYGGCGRHAEPSEEYCLECQMSGKAPAVRSYNRRGDVEPQHDHEITCMLCSRGYYFKMTDTLARLHQKAGTVPLGSRWRKATCTSCGGVLMIDRSDIGSISSVGKVSV